MIEELKTYWPIIVQQPWAFIWVFVTGFTLGAAVPTGWRWLFPVAPASPKDPDAQKGVWARLFTRKFRPNKIQIRCIRGLRAFDHRHLLPVELATFINNAQPDNKLPLADVEQALDQLCEQEWARWQFRSTGVYGQMEQAYQLMGSGQDYARDKKFPVGVA